MPPKKREDEEEFDGQASSGAANCQPVKASGVKKGDYLMIRGHPCKCMATSTAKTGKHGGAKCHITGLDIFTNKKNEIICGSTCDVDAPIVTKRDLMLCDYDKEDHHVTAMSEATNEEESFKVDDETILKQLAEVNLDESTYFITVMEAVGIQAVIAVKEDK